MPTYSSYCYFTSNSVQYKPLDPLELKRNFLRLGLNSRHWENLPNSFYLPRGSKPGYGWILLLGSESKALDKSRSDHSLTFVGPNTITISNLIITDVRVLTAEAWEVSDNAAVMIQLQDIRYKCQMIAGNEVYNPNTPNADGTKLYTTGSHAKYYRTTTPFTWATMIADIESLLPVSVSLTNAVFPTSLPEDYHFRGVSAMDALAKIAHDTGHHLTLNNAGTTISLITGEYTATQPDYTPWLADFNGGEVIDTVTESRPHPAKIKVYFPKRDYAFQAGSTGEPHWNDLYINEPLHEEEVDVATLSTFPAGAPILAGTSVALHSNLLARFDEAGVALNASEIDNTAIDLAENYFTYGASDDDAGIVRGAWAILLDSVIPKVGWYDTGKGLHTKVGEERGDPLPVFSSREDVGQKGSLLPATLPHLGVHHETTHRWGIATLSADLAPDQSVNGVVQYGTWNTTGANNHIDWAASNNTIRIYNSFPVNYVSGDRVYVVYHRQVDRWLCLAPVQGEDRVLTRFKMKSKLPLAGKGIAIEIGSGPTYTEVGSAFPIKDPWSDPGSWRDDTDDGQIEGSYMGWCFIPANPELADANFLAGAYEGLPFYEVVWMEQIATYINFTSTGVTTKDVGTPSNPWTITATINSWYQGKDPADTQEFTGTVTLHDPQQIFPYIMSGSKGLARYNDKLHRYEIVNVNQMAFAATAKLSATMCNDAATGSITGVKSASFSVFGMEPDISSARNTHGMCGVADDEVTLLYVSGAVDAQSDPDPHWRIISVDHKEIEVILDHRIIEVGDPACCQHQVKRVKLCTMSCDDIAQIPWEVVDGPTSCCQEQIIPGCCGCPDAPMSVTSVIDLVFTGALTGTLTLSQTPGGCVSWTGTLTSPGGPCASEFASSTFTITCQDDSATPILITPTGGGAECAFRTGSFAPDSYDCGTVGDPGIAGDFTIPTRDVIAGDPLTTCACG